MSDRVHLSLTIGPVQGFVGQARRTRDLWAGSWLLSYLAETALAAAENAGGEAIIPARSDQERGKVTSTGTVVGGVPNRFETTHRDEADAKKAAEAAKDAFFAAWQRIADAVWNKYVAPVATHGHDTEVIWKRQVAHFWEVSWVVGTPGPGEKTLGRLAAARKAYRNVPAVEEPGVKCSLMGALQELSGHFGRGAGTKQKDFWTAVSGAIGEHDLREGERLCAIALIKRLFPHVVTQAIGDSVSDDLKKQESWPSLAFFCALPWLRKLDACAPSDTNDYINLAVKSGIGRGESQAAADADIHWAKVDGAAWFKSALRNNDWRVDPKAMPALQQSLSALYEKVPDGPVPFYALLLMDGDSMGKLLGLLAEPGELSRCLGTFSDKVDEIVRRHDGRTIYAGGDDVLAILPAQPSFCAAKELANAYQQSFQDTAAKEQATLSGALVYAHWRHPMQQVLRIAHHLLDDVAKDRTGRDALAIGIVQGSGLNAVWPAPWEFVRGADPRPALEKMLDYFSGEDVDQEKAVFNASYLYSLRTQFSRLLPAMDEEAGAFGTLNGSGAILTDIAHAEYRRRMKQDDRKAKPPSDTRGRIEDLMALSQRWTRDAATRRSTSDANAFGFDGWRVARFMKQVQEGKVDDHE